MRTPPPILLVTDPAYPDDAIVRRIEDAARAPPPRSLAVQLRDKRRDLDAVRHFARRLREVTRSVGALFLVNGHATIAREVAADGVHLGVGAGTVAEARAVAGRDAWITVAAHSDAAVTTALEQHADAVLVSPVFASHGKGPARGVAAIAHARSIGAGDIAIYALGGVTPHNAGDCIAAGADGVAVIRALLLSEDPAGVARAFHDVMQYRAFR